MEFELRFVVETWREYRDGMDAPITHIEKPILQYKTKETIVWRDVPIVHLDVYGQTILK